MQKNIDIRIHAVEPLQSPAALARMHPVSAELTEAINNSRQRVNDIIQGRDNRLLDLVGPS